VVIDADGAPFLESDDTSNPLRSVPALLVSHTTCRIADIVISPAQLGSLIEVFDRTPLAAMALTLLLRGSETRSTDEGLVAESLTYSMLQGGPEFAAWRLAYQSRNRIAEIGPAVQVEDRGDALVLTLSRPHVHNAFSRRMRDELSDALVLARSLPDEQPVVLRGVGRSFCSGGDLGEFGSFPSIVESHLTRLTRSPARLLADISDRVTVQLHGACMGAGIELPAYARWVVATSDTVISLPEINLGLVPGAGGTVSIPRRIGRQRTAWLALTGERIDAQRALEWGLVDEIVDEHTN
jgi:enoyl-CoA hydratase/carnithine racemase